MILKLLVFNIFIEIIVLIISIYYSLSNEDYAIISVATFIILYLIIIFIYFLIYGNDENKCNLKKLYKGKFNACCNNIENMGCFKILAIIIFIVFFLIYLLFKFFKFIGNIGRIILFHILSSLFSCYCIGHAMYIKKDDYKDNYLFIGSNAFYLFFLLLSVVIIECVKRERIHELKKKKKD